MDLYVFAVSTFAIVFCCVVVICIQKEPPQMNLQLSAQTWYPYEAKEANEAYAVLVDVV